MLFSCAINAKEGRYVAVTDIPRASLHVDMNEEVNIQEEDTIAELIVKLKPKLYRKYIWRNKNDKPILYIKLTNALYGTLQAALL